LRNLDGLRIGKNEFKSKLSWAILKIGYVLKGELLKYALKNIVIISNSQL